jgi:hypothetical protein
MKAILTKNQIEDYPQMCSKKLFNHLMKGEVIEKKWWDNQYPDAWVVKVDGKYYEARENRNLTYEVLNA